jgi:uncharacterized lipoprotein YmbA
MVRVSPVLPPLICAAVLAVAGCHSVPPSHYYLLGAPGSAAPASEAAPETVPGLRIGIEPFAVDPPYDQERLVYRVGRGSLEVGFYGYHRWAAPLDRLLPPALAPRLAATPGVAEVEPSSGGGDYDARLHGRVVYLEEVDVEEGQMARIELDLELVDRDGELLWSRPVAAEVSGRAETVPGVVRQMEQALDQLAAEVRAELGAVLAERFPTETEGALP